MNQWKSCMVAIAISNAMLSATAQQTAEKFILETQYLLSLPEGYDNDTSRKWPLLIFLHGSGESGTDLAKVKVHGPPKLVEQGKKFPFIIVSPQAPPNLGWQSETLYQLLQYLKKSHRVDKDRVYLTGLSMGGYGTWELAMKHPEEFAAIAPVCGGGDSSNAWKLRNIPIWNFHGAKDDVVYPEESNKMVTAARKVNRDVRYTLYPDANHNSWDLTYANDSLYYWLLSKTKFKYKEIPVKPSVLKQYVGTYVGPGKDTVRLMLHNDTLVARNGPENTPLRPASDERFFIDPDYPADLAIIRSKGRVSAFLFHGNKRTLFKKVK